MRKQLEYKLKDFAEKRSFAETKERKELIDSEVIGYLTRRCRETKEFMNAYDYYKELKNDNSSRY